MPLCRRGTSGDISNVADDGIAAHVREGKKETDWLAFLLKNTEKAHRRVHLHPGGVRLFYSFYDLFTVNTAKLSGRTTDSLPECSTEIAGIGKSAGFNDLTNFQRSFHQIFLGCRNAA